MFTDIINVGIEDDLQKKGGKFSADHWINKPLVEENGLTLLMVAIKSDLPDFVSVLLRAGADAQLVNPERGHLAPIHVAVQSSSLKSLRLLVIGIIQHRAWVSLKSFSKDMKRMCHKKVTRFRVKQFILY